MSSIISLLPAGFLYARNLTAMGQRSETVPAQTELSHVGARSAADLASVDSLRRVFWLLHRLVYFGFASQEISPLLSKGHTHCSKKITPFLICLRCCGNCNVHTTYFCHLIVINLRKDKLFLKSHGIVPSTVETIR